MTPRELAEAIYERQRQGTFARGDRPMPAWRDLSLEVRTDRVKNARRLQQAYHRCDAREVPLQIDTPTR